MRNLEIPLHRARSTRHRRAIILVFVLLLLALCGATFSQFASKVIRLNAKAASGQRALQTRWGTVSLRRALLQAAPVLLFSKQQSVSPENSRQQLVVRLNIRLGGQSLSAQLEDECAKLPIQIFLKDGSTEKLRPLLRELCGASTQLQPIISENATSWSQIFRLPELSHPRNSLWRLEQATSKLTLYSDGRLNLRACNAETLDAAWRYKFGVSGPQSLHNTRNLAWIPDIATMANACGLSPLETQYLVDRFSLTSNTYSLWIDGTNQSGYGFTGVYILRHIPGFAEEHFGFHAL